ncbi:MAG: isoprenylcysteine carboxylmethyltransferase family protein [Woeseiaceae bacterium]
MHTSTLPCPRILNYKPPRIAFALLIIASALNIVFGSIALDLAASLPAAAIVGASGFLLMLRAWWLFKQANTAICPTAQTTTLLTNDVYAWTRNPMYLGIVLMLLAVALITGSVFHYVAAILFFAIIDHSFCPYEEEKMRANFATRFPAYARRVRRWF